jgi:RimJ/RimL family protein N-acetyltransferase
MRCPERIETARLVLRRPRAEDARAIFERYASDRDATRYMAWPIHRTVGDTQGFLTVSDAEWAGWPGGPYVVETRSDGRLVGGTGFAFETPDRAATGYIFAREEWGKGYATETLSALVDVAATVGVRELCAVCHVDHRPSRHVLEKCGFRREGRLPRHTDFPNLRVGPCDVFSYVRTFPR